MSTFSIFWVSEEMAEERRRRLEEYEANARIALSAFFRWHGRWVRTRLKRDYYYRCYFHVKYYHFRTLADELRLFELEDEIKRAWAEARRLGLVALPKEVARALSSRIYRIRAKLRRARGILLGIREIAEKEKWKLPPEFARKEAVEFFTEWIDRIIIRIDDNLAFSKDLLVRIRVPPVLVEVFEIKPLDFEFVRREFVAPGIVRVRRPRIRKIEIFPILGVAYVEKYKVGTLEELPPEGQREWLEDLVKEIELQFTMKVVRRIRVGDLKLLSNGMSISIESPVEYEGLKEPADYILRWDYAFEPPPPKPASIRPTVIVDVIKNRFYGLVDDKAVWTLPQIFGQAGIVARLMGTKSAKISIRRITIPWTAEALRRELGDELYEYLKARIKIP